MSGNQKGMSWRSETKEVRVDELSFNLPRKTPNIFHLIGERIRQKWPEVLVGAHEDNRSESIPIVRILLCTMNGHEINLRYGKIEIRKTKEPEHGVFTVEIGAEEGENSYEC